MLTKHCRHARARIGRGTTDRCTAGAPASRPSDEALPRMSHMVGRGAAAACTPSPLTEQQSPPCPIKPWRGGALMTPKGPQPLHGTLKWGGVPRIYLRRSGYVPHNM